MSALRVHGKYLFDGEAKHFLRGVSYGPFAPNSRGERYPEADRVDADFAAMRALGVNTVRVYVPPPDWMMESAMRRGLRLMVGIPWPYHVAFLDDAAMKIDIRNSVRETVSAMRKYAGAIVAFSIGNEIRSDIVRWHGPRAISRFLGELYDIAKNASPESMVTYSNYPSTEYLDLDFLDFISFNVYLHDESDYRRYLTHLMAISGDRPLVLSETGMDTIREGEPKQAAMLEWQARAAFELGLSGFIVFAYTDEWHTGGSEIADWAFGLTRRDRSPKPAAEAITRSFLTALPPALPAAPRASVVVAAYDAEQSIERCVNSVRALNYPDFETIVVDDGSTDATSQLAQAAGARVLKLDHRGLASARNAGVEAASGEIVAFIDADAIADRDWLYHLVETMTRRGTAAVGGPGLLPEPQSSVASGLSAAPGLPREVRSGEDRLSHLCGCNMAIRRDALLTIGGFDPAFDRAGDDTDISWRLTAAGHTLAHAPGAVVIHEPRTTFQSYLAQQRGYGAAEGMLFRKYPMRAAADGGVYAGSSWLASLLNPARVYYGAFGRGLFQTVYSTGASIAELPLSPIWIAASFALLICGLGSRLMGVVGGAGLTISALIPILAAASARLPHRKSGLAARIVLGIATALGPIVRSLARSRVIWKLGPRAPGEEPSRGLELSGELLFERPADALRFKTAAVIDAVRRALNSRGLAVASSDGFQAFDLEIIVPPLIRVPINAIDEGDRGIAMIWRVRIAPRRAAATLAIVAFILLSAGLTFVQTLGATVAIVCAVGLLLGARLRRIPAIIRVAQAQAARAVAGASR